MRDFIHTQNKRSQFRVLWNIKWSHVYSKCIFIAMFRSIQQYIVCDLWLIAANGESLKLVCGAHWHGIDATIRFFVPILHRRPYWNYSDVYFSHVRSEVLIRTYDLADNFAFQMKIRVSRKLLTGIPIHFRIIITSKWHIPCAPSL